MLYPHKHCMMSTRPLTHFARASAIEVYHLKMMCKQGIEGSAVA